MLREPCYYDLDPLVLAEDVRIRANDLVDDGHATQRELAERAGVPYTTFTLWLRGVRPLYSLGNLHRAWRMVQELEAQHYEVR